MGETKNYLNQTEMAFLAFVYPQSIFQWCIRDMVNKHGLEPRKPWYVPRKLITVSQSIIKSFFTLTTKTERKN